MSSAKQSRQSVAIILPEQGDLKAFRESLATELSTAVADGEPDLITHPGRGNEITLVKIKNLFPARFVEDVAFLRDRYQQRMKEQNAHVELHSEGDGSQFPLRTRR